jgi:hypothetical protein
MMAFRVICPFVAGSEYTRQAYEREALRAIESMNRRGVRYAVAPRCAIEINGHTYKAGEQIRASKQVLGELIRSGRVLEADVIDDDDGPAAA